MGKYLFLIIIALFFVSCSNKVDVTKEDTITKDVKVEEQVTQVFQPPKKEVK